MKTMIDPYIERLNQRINAICPNISDSLGQIKSIETDAALKILQELVASACQATNALTITTARKMIAKLPPDWLEANVDDAVQKRLNLADDWEYRRLLELLRDVRPSMMAKFVTIGLSSPNVDVREVAHDFAAGRHGPVDGLGDTGIN